MIYDAFIFISENIFRWFVCILAALALIEGIHCKIEKLLHRG